VVDTSEGVMKVISVQSSDGEEGREKNDGAATAREDGENVHHEEEEEEDKGLGRELEDEDFDEGISDISTHDTIINPSNSNSKYAHLLLGTRTKTYLLALQQKTYFLALEQKTYFLALQQKNYFLALEQNTYFLALEHKTSTYFLALEQKTYFLAPERKTYRTFWH
jgi:hypothetical protein